MKNIRLDSELIKLAEKASKTELRTVPKQIEYWAKLGRIFADNPDLPLDLIKQIMISDEEIKTGDVADYDFD